MIAKLLLLTRLPFNRLFMVTGGEQPGRSGARGGANYQTKRNGAGRKRPKRARSPATVSVEQAEGMNPGGGELA